MMFKFNLSFIFYAALVAAAACAAPTTDLDTTSSDTPASTTSTSIAPSISVAPTSSTSPPAPSSTCPSGPGIPWNGVGHTSDPNDIRYGVTLCDQQYGGSDCYYLITIDKWLPLLPVVPQGGRWSCRDVPDDLLFGNNTLAIVPDKGIQCMIYSDTNCTVSLRPNSPPIMAPEVHLLDGVHGVACTTAPDTDTDM